MVNTITTKFTIDSSQTNHTFLQIAFLKATCFKLRDVVHAYFVLTYLDFILALNQVCMTEIFLSFYYSLHIIDGST